jgi:hypothetical protein
MENLCPTGGRWWRWSLATNAQAVAKSRGIAWIFTCSSLGSRERNERGPTQRPGCWSAGRGKPEGSAQAGPRSSAIIWDAAGDLKPRRKASARSLASGSIMQTSHSGPSQQTERMLPCGPVKSCMYPANHLGSALRERFILLASPGRLMVCMPHTPRSATRQMCRMNCDP